MLSAPQPENSGIGYLWHNIADQEEGSEKKKKMSDRMEINPPGKGYERRDGHKHGVWESSCARMSMAALKVHFGCIIRCVYTVLKYELQSVIFTLILNTHHPLS